MVTLWHPKLKTTIEVTERSARVHRKSGWTDPPKKTQKTRTGPAREAGPSDEQED